MSDNVLETVRATVQDFLAPELRTHGVRLDNIERRLEDTKHSLEQRLEDTKKSLEQRIEESKKNLEVRIEDGKSSLQHQINDTKETLRAEMRALQSRFEILEVRFGSLEELIRAWVRQNESGGALRERVALLEARMPKQ